MSADERRREERAVHPAFRDQDRGHVPDGAPAATAGGFIECVVMDLSVGGCAVLLHKDAGTLPKELAVSFEGEDSILWLRSTPRWQDDGYSRTHRQVGLQFTLLRAEDVEELEGLLARFETEGLFQCELQPC